MRLSGRGRTWRLTGQRSLLEKSGAGAAGPSGSGARTPAPSGVGRAGRGGRAGLCFSGLPRARFGRALQRGGRSAVGGCGSDALERPSLGCNRVTFAQYFRVAGVAVAGEPCGPQPTVPSGCARSQGAPSPLARGLRQLGVRSGPWAVALWRAATGRPRPLGVCLVLICRGDLCELSIVWVRAALRAASEAVSSWVWLPKAHRGARGWPSGWSM